MDRYEAIEFKKRTKQFLKFRESIEDKVLGISYSKLMTKKNSV